MIMMLCKRSSIFHVKVVATAIICIIMILSSHLPVCIISLHFVIMNIITSISNSPRWCGVSSSDHIFGIRRVNVIHTRSRWRLMHVILCVLILFYMCFVVYSFFALTCFIFVTVSGDVIVFHDGIGVCDKVN